MKRIITLSALALLLAAAGSLQAGEREHESERHHDRPHHGKPRHHEHEALDRHHRRDRHPVRRIRTRERIVVRERHRPACVRDAYRHGWHNSHAHAHWIEHGPRCVQRRTVVRERIVREPSWHDGEVTLFINYPIWY